MMNHYIITEEMIKSWRKGCINLSNPHTDDDMCKKCEYRGKGMREKCCNFGDTDVEKIFRSHPYNPQVEREKVLRPEVLTFALLMERKLRKYDKDRGDSYKTTDVDYLLMRLREEVKELHNAIEDDPWDGKGVSLGEAVDVGNISMMIGYHDYQFPMDVFIEELVEELRQQGKDGEL
jgi:hypothetical protein